MMNVTQGSTGAEWRLDAGEARSLSIGPGPRVLRVASGALWITASGEPDAPADDVWLREGESLALDDGAEVLIEGWPEARFQLLVPPCTKRAQRNGLTTVLRRLAV